MTDTSLKAWRRTAWILGGTGWVILGIVATVGLVATHEHKSSDGLAMTLAISEITGGIFILLAFFLQFFVTRALDRRTKDHLVDQEKPTEER
jgi:hypothetical protein